MQAKEGASRKALIFTESTKTQAYLKEYLEANGLRKVKSYCSMVVVLTLKQHKYIKTGAKLILQKLVASNLLTEEWH